MKLIYTLLLIGICSLCNGQILGSKVSFTAADNKPYTGKIIQIEEDRFKIKYEGFDFESWLLKTQFTVIEEKPDHLVNVQAPSPDLPPTQAPSGAVQQNPQAEVTGPVEQQGHNAPNNVMTRSDSLKMALTDMKKALEAASKLFVGKSDTLSIVIPDIDYENAGLIKLKESLTKIKGTRSVVMRYSDSTARLELVFKGKTADLWDVVPADIRMMFKLVEAGEKQITLKYK